jgi:hypothetical protein
MSQATIDYELLFTGLEQLTEIQASTVGALCTLFSLLATLTGLAGLGIITRMLMGFIPDACMAGNGVGTFVKIYSVTFGIIVLPVFLGLVCQVLVMVARSSLFSTKVLQAAVNFDRAYIGIPVISTLLQGILLRSAEDMEAMELRAAIAKDADLKQLHDELAKKMDQNAIDRQRIDAQILRLRERAHSKKMDPEESQRQVEQFRERLGRLAQMSKPFAAALQGNADALKQSLPSGSTLLSDAVDKVTAAGGDLKSKVGEQLQNANFGSAGATLQKAAGEIRRE